MGSDVFPSDVPFEKGHRACLFNNKLLPESRKEACVSRPAPLMVLPRRSTMKMAWRLCLVYRHDGGQANSRQEGEGAPSCHLSRGMALAWSLLLSCLSWWKAG